MHAFRKTWLLMALSAGSLTGPAQSFQGGLLAGINGSQVDGDSYAGYDKAGFQGGVFVRYDLTPRFTTGLEIKYSGRGARNPASEDNTGSYKLSLHYIDVPVTALYHLKDWVGIEIGLVPGYLFAIGGEDDAGTLPDEFLVDFRKFDLGTLIGIQARITPALTVFFRHSYSLISIRDLETAGAYYSWFGKLFGHSSGDYNNYLSLGIQYLLKGSHD